MCLVKAWAANDRLSIIWMSDLFNIIKQFHPSSSHVNTTVWMHHKNTDKTHREKDRWKLHKNAMSHIEQILEAMSYETTVVWLLTTHL